MTYTTATMTSPTPAKDLMAAVGAQLTAAGLSLVETYPALTAANWNAVTYGGGQFVAVCSGTVTAATSPDGITWTQRTLPQVTTWSSVAYGGGLYVAVSSGNSVAATSPDGITWTLRAMPMGIPWTSVTYGGGLFVAVSSTGSNVAASSPDGVNWTVRYLPVSSNWSSVAYGGGLFVAVSSSSGTTAATSPDGITWTSRALAATGTWTSVTYGGGLFVAVAQASATACTSPDGITWTARSMTGPGTQSWTSVTYGGGQFVAVATVGVTTAGSSPDGITWTARTLPSAANWQSVAYGAGVFVTTANNSLSVAATSPDGAAFTARTLPATSAATISDVYKSPGTANQFGQDWYLILSRTNDYAALMSYQVAEQYSTVTHKAANYGGTGQLVAPTASTYANPGAAGLPGSVLAAAAYLNLNAGQAFTYWISATVNRLVVAVKVGGVESGFYAGLYDDLLPAGTTQFPLVCTKLPSSQSGSFALGSNSPALVGGFTREPLQSGVTSSNFEAIIHNGFVAGVGAVLAGGFTPACSPWALYGNPNSVSRVMLGTARPVTALADALRGLLIGCVTSQLPSVCGDTVTSGGKTYVRFAGPAPSYGIFVDQGA